MAGSLLEYGGFVSKDGTQQLLQNISVFSDAPCVMEQIGNSAAQKIASGRFTGSVSADGQVVEFTDAASGSDGRHRTTLALPRGPFIALFEYQVADGVSPDLTADEIRDAASRKLEQVWQDCQRQSGESVCG